MTQTVEEQQQSASVYNHIQIVGRIGNSPARVNENAPTKFSIAVSQNGDKGPMWLGVDCWEQLAIDVLANKRLYKGVLVEVQGRLAMNQYQGKRYYNIVASSVKMVAL